MDFSTVGCEGPRSMRSWGDSGQLRAGDIVVNEGLKRSVVSEGLTHPLRFQALTLVGYVFRDTDLGGSGSCAQKKCSREAHAGL